MGLGKDWTIGYKKSRNNKKLYKKFGQYFQASSNIYL